jgi:hypothetical protein
VPRLTGRAAGSIKVASTATAARVQGGGKRVPYYPWLDFGGRVGRRHAVNRPFLKEGRYIWAAFAEHRGEVQKKLRSELTKLARVPGWGHLMAGLGPTVKLTFAGDDKQTSRRWKRSRRRPTGSARSSPDRQGHLAARRRGRQRGQHHRRRDRRGHRPVRGGAADPRARRWPVPRR